MRYQTPSITASSLNIIAGGALLFAPLLFLYTPYLVGAVISAILGMVVMLFACIRIYNDARFRWMSWINALIGLWVIVSPWVLGYSADHIAIWGHLIVGGCIAALGAWSAWSTGSGRYVTR